jgi:3',5'-cyclic AMP phosphodiesterase CpdA
MDILNSTERLWNLRRGDADDDRTSPQGRGWRKLAVSAALEFNYLMAPLAFVGLILGPALLIGLAPFVFAAFGRQGIGAAVVIRSHPIAAIVTLAVLVALAILVGRPVIRRVVDDFWHLYYTLVFPVFVVLRELICAAAERLPGDRVTPEGLFRRRRIATVLATLLFAGSGIALVLSVGFSTDPALVDPRRAGALAAAALANAGVVLGVSTVAASLYWFVREISSTRPVLNWVPGAPTADPAATVRVAHLSDLHAVGGRYSYRMESGTKGPRGNRKIRCAFRKLAAMHAVTPLDHIVVTGDITDAGTRDEWLEVADLVRQSRGFPVRVLFVPGNHDVNVVDRTNPGRLDLPWSVGQALRKLRVVLALDAIEGDLVHVLDSRSGAIGPSLQEYLRDGQRPALLRGLAESGTRRGRQEMDKTWDEIFPLVMPPPKEGGCGVIMLDSNARRHFSLTNAVGVVGRSQLRGVTSTLRTFSSRAWVVLIHHHIVDYPIPSIPLSERIGVALINATDVLKAIACHGAPVVVMHGHRHRAWVGTCGQVSVCSAPSVSLGSKSADTPRGGFHVYDLRASGHGGLEVTASERIII